MTKYEDLKQLGDKIMNWDTENIKDLTGMLQELYDETDVYNEIQKDNYDALDFIDTQEIPIATFPKGFEFLEQHTDYPIWTCDKQGNCLTDFGGNSSMNDPMEVTPASEIAEFYRGCEERQAKGESYYPKRPKQFTLPVSVLDKMAHGPKCSCDYCENKTKQGLWSPRLLEAILDDSK